MNNKDLCRVTREVILILENEDFEVGMNALGSALISICLDVFKKDSPYVLQKFCDNIFKVINDIKNGTVETMPITLDERNKEKS